MVRVDAQVLPGIVLSKYIAWVLFQVLEHLRFLSCAREIDETDPNARFSSIQGGQLSLNLNSTFPQHSHTPQCL